MSVIPAAASIESAADSIAKADPDMLTGELREIAAFGNARIQQVLTVCKGDTYSAYRRHV